MQNGEDVTFTSSMPQFWMLDFATKTKITQSRAVVGFFNALSLAHIYLFMFMCNLYFSEVCLHLKKYS